MSKDSASTTDRPLTIPATLPCPFCGADAEAGWVMDEKEGKSMRVACSRDGECPSPEWQEPASYYESDAECVDGVIHFWNTRVVDWENGWQQSGRTGTKPKEPVLVYTIARAAEHRMAEAIGVPFADGCRYAIARWQKGNWRDVVNGRIYLVCAWRYLTPPPDRWMK